MMKQPELAAKVTLLPVYDLGVDAAILFSDILVIPYAMGMGLDFTDKGPVFDTPLAFTDNPLKYLNPEVEKLQYIYNVITEIQKTKPKAIPLIGFCGAPLTVLLYMLQGIGRKAEFPDAIKFIYKHKQTTKKLIQAITELSLTYIRGQVQHGINVFQLFDTHAGIIPFDLYKELFFPAIRKIAATLRELSVPYIYFPKGIGLGLTEITPEYADFVSIDWQTSLQTARKMLHKEIGIQGNIDPRLLFAPKKEIEKRLQSYLRFGREHQDWIINMGHGFMPGLPYENAKFLADWIRSSDWGR